MIAKYAQVNSILNKLPKEQLNKIPRKYYRIL